MKKCAYCGRAERLTKEHVWPSVFIRKYDDLLTYNKGTNKFYKGDAVIKDVCAECNNNHLSKLDSYLGNLHDEYMSEIIVAGADAFLKYDYELLLRGLLKISFNSVRTSGNEKGIKAHQRFAKYILEGGHRGSVKLRLQIVTSSRSIDLRNGTEEVIGPNALRCADIGYDGKLSNRFFVRLVGINSFWFYVVFSYGDEPRHKWKMFTEYFENWILAPGINIPSNSNELYIPSAKTTYFDFRLLGSLLDAEPRS